MAPIYKVWMHKPSDAYLQLSEQEQNAVLAKLGDLAKQCGGKPILQCFSAWSNQEWPIFGLEEWPNVEALQRYHSLIYETGLARYGEDWSLLGTKWPPE